MGYLTTQAWFLIRSECCVCCSTNTREHVSVSLCSITVIALNTVFEKKYGQSLMFSSSIAGLVLVGHKEEGIL